MKRADCRCNTSTWNGLPRPPHRRGAVLIMVLVALGLVALLGGALVSLAGMEQEVLAARERECQAHWLAEAGIDRAIARLAADAAYAGDSWSLANEELAGRGPASVTVQVESLAGSPSRRLLTVEAVFPTDSAKRARSMKHLELELPQGRANTP
jgi:Tfp pilus assembly protein PilX